MSLNQSQLNDYFSEFRIDRTDGPYPPYHTGKYLEEYFVDKWIQWNSICKYRLLIPVYWTAVFNHKASLGLHEGSENNLLRNRKQWTGIPPLSFQTQMTYHFDGVTNLFL